MEKRLTKKDVINQMLGERVVQENEIYKNYLEHELELLDRKNSSKGLNKTQKENEIVANALIEELAKVGKPITITDLMNTSEFIKTYTYEVKVDGEVKLMKLSNQKISAIFKQLVNNNKIVKVVDKKKSYFSIAE